MGCSPLFFPVLQQLLKFTVTHVHYFSDAIQPSHPLLPPSPSAFNLSQHQGLSQRNGSSHYVGKILELQIQHQCFQWIFRVDCLEDGLVWHPCTSRDCSESSSIAQFKYFIYIKKNSAIVLKTVMHREGHLHQGVRGFSSEPRQELSGNTDRSVQVWAQSPWHPEWKIKPKIRASSPGVVNVQNDMALHIPDLRGRTALQRT